jgi:Phage integrase family
MSLSIKEIRAMSTITTKDGTEICYQDRDEGPVVTFSHGWPLNAGAWRRPDAVPGPARLPRHRVPPAQPQARRPGTHGSRRTGLSYGALLVAAGLGPPGEHALISLLALNSLRVSEATGADIEHLGLERGHRTLTITRKGGKVVTIPLAPRTARAIDLAIGERTDGPMFLAADRRRLDRHGAGRIVRKTARHAGISKSVTPHTLRHAFITAALDAGCRCVTCRRPPPMRIRGPRCGMTTLGNCISRARNRRSPGRVGIGMAFLTSGQRPSDQARNRADPFGCKIRPPEGRGSQWALLRAHRGREGGVAAGLRRPGRHSDSCDT